MSDNKIATRRVYSFDLPVHIPFLAIGFVKQKFKKIGVWDNMPVHIKRKTKAAGWGGLTITKKDLDSLPDDVWLTMARELRTRMASTGASGVQRRSMRRGVEPPRI